MVLHGCTSYSTAKHISPADALTGFTTYLLRGAGFAGRGKEDSLLVLLFFKVFSGPKLLHKQYRAQGKKWKKKPVPVPKLADANQNPDIFI